MINQCLLKLEYTILLIDNQLKTFNILITKIYQYFYYESIPCAFQ